MEEKPTLKTTPEGKEDLEDLLIELGGFGRYQKRLFCLLVVFLFAAIPLLQSQQARSPVLLIIPFGGMFVWTKFWNLRLFKSELSFQSTRPNYFSNTRLATYLSSSPSQWFTLHIPHHKCLPGDQLPTYREMNLTREEWDWVSLKTDKHWWGIDTAHSPHS